MKQYQYKSGDTTFIGYVKEKDFSKSKTRVVDVGGYDVKVNKDHYSLIRDASKFINIKSLNKGDIIEVCECKFKITSIRHEQPYLRATFQFVEGV